VEMVVLRLKHGKNGEDLIIEVPVGTVVIDRLMVRLLLN